ncbi:unnamed protein product [Lactuca virosa]|uniref:Uncharacterized protein n=1 Tax=Lactuca virosa TaxID=75947 RepID=A0AAU9N8U1_9ASTR|nr:unnamed protein product [Lactuca virosa]
MPSGPKKRRAARRKRGSNANHTEDEVEDAVEVFQTLSNGDMKAESHEHVEKSKDVPVVEECDSVGSNGKQESVHDEKIITHATVMVESSDSVGNKEKESESEAVDQILIQPISKEIKGNEDDEVDDGFSVVKESEKNSKEVVLQDPFEEPRVDTVDQVVQKELPLQEAQDLSVPIESVSEVNVETFTEDAQDSLKELSVVHENEGVEVGESELVKDVSVVKNEGEDQDPSEETKESSSREFDQSILKNIHIKEADQIPTESAESVIEVDVDAISFEDAEDSFKTPLGSPSIGYMSQVIRSLNKLAQNPYLAADSVDEVNVQKSLKEDQDSITEPHGVSSLVDVSPVEEIVQGIEVAEGGESASHVEPVLKVEEEISKESVLEEEVITEGFSQELVKPVDELLMEAIPLEKAQDPIKYSLEEVVKGNVCGVGECTCDYPLINYVVSEDKKMSFRGVSKKRSKKPNGKFSHDPEEMFDNIDMSRVEGFVRFNGHGNEPIGLSSRDDVASVEGVVPGNETVEIGKGEFNHVLVLKEEEEIMPIEGVLEETNGRSSDEPKVMVKTLDHSIPGDSVSEANVETFLEDAEEYSPKVPLGINSFLVKRNEYEEVGEKETLVNPFVLGIEDEEDDEDMSIGDGVLEEPLEEKKIETSSDELQATLKMVDNSVLDAEESLSEANVDTSLKDAQGSFKEPIRESSMDDVLHDADSVMKENEDMSMEDVLEKPIPRSSDEPQPMNKRVDQDLSTQAKSIEVNVDASFEVTQDSFKVPLEDSSMDDLSHVEAGDQSESHGEDFFKDKGYESATMVNQVELVMEEKEEKSIEGVLEESFEHSSNEPELIVKTVNQSILKEAQHPSLAEESESVIDVLPIEAMVEGNEVVEVHESASEYSLQEPKAIIKTIAQFILKGLHYKEDHDPSVLEVNEDTSSEDSQVSFETPLGSPSVDHVSPNEAFAQWNESTESIEENVESRLKDAKNSPIDSSGSFSLVDMSYMEGVEENESAEVVSFLKDDKEVSMEGVLEEGFEKKVGDSSHEQEAMVNTIDSVEVDEKEVSMEGVLEEHFEKKDGDFLYEQEAMVNTIDSVEAVSVLKDEKEMSLEGVLEEQLEKKVGDSSHEQEEMVNTIDRSLLQEKEAEDLSTPVESVTEVNVETSIKDSQDSLKEPLEIPSMDDVSPLEGVVQGNEFGEIGESEEISVEGVVQDPLEEPIGNSSQELEEIVKTEDQLDLKEIPLEETQIPSLQDDSVIEVIKDVDSLKEPLGSSSIMEDDGDMSMEGVLQDPFKEPSGSSLHDHLTLEELHLKEEAEDPSILSDSVIKVNVDKSIEDAQDLYETPPGSPSVGHVSPVEGFEANIDHSSMEALESFSMADVSSMKSVVQGNESTEVDEKSLVSMEGVIKEPFKDPVGPSADELQTMVKTVDQLFQDPSLQGNVQEKEFTEGSEDATMDNHVESLKKENEDLSLEDVLEVPFEKPFGDFSHEKEATVNITDRSLLKEIPLKDAEDPFEKVESATESPSLVDVFPVEGNKFNNVSETACHDSPTMVNHVVSLESSSMVNGTPVEGVGQRNGQRNEMVGLVRTLLEEIRRIRAFYEEGLRQTTKIDLQMLEILEKYDSTR